MSGGDAIFVWDVSSFFGGVRNRGTLFGGSGGSGIAFEGANVVSGGVTNAGAIRAISTGIALYSVSTFAGDITNSKGATISAGQIGIRLGAFGDLPVSFFTGNILNSGTITAKTGISISDSTIAGAIIDSGTIVATSHGILIDSAGEIVAGKTAIVIAGPTFTGGISNFGVISGSAGIEIKTAHPVSIFDAGAILAAPGGTAIQFAGSGNTLTLGAGYTISGTVDPSGKPPGITPSRTPRALAACSAALVRAEIISRSCSATAARMWSVRRVACGLSQATNSTPASIMVAMNATLRESRSSLAMTSRALCFRQAARAFCSSGRSLRLPVSTSVCSAMRMPPMPAR
jgi:hypothetical protein